MDDARFDGITRALDARLTRRHAGGLATGALLALGLAMDADAKKKKKKRKKKRKKKNKGGISGGRPPLDTGPNYACGALDESCGNTPICQCRLNTNNQKVCTNVVIPPNGADFFPCLSQANCPAGTYCDLLKNQCQSACVN